MPRVRINIWSNPRAEAFRLALASAGLLAVATIADAQEAGLRGALQPEQADAANQPAYVPAGEGSEADFIEEDGDGLAAGAFANSAPLPASRPPLTARERNVARRDAAALAGTTSGGTQEAAAEEDQPTGTVRTQPVGPAANIGVPDGAGPVQPIEGLQLPPQDENPFAPVGIRVGSFILRPSVEQGLAATTNADYSVDGSEAVLSETTLRLNATSDWSRNSAVIDAFGTFRKSLSGEEVSDFLGAAVGTFELDMTDEWTARAILGYETAPETASSPVTIPDVLDEPIRQTISGSLGIEKDAGKARLALTGRIENDTYGDAELVDGTELSQEDRDSTMATVTLRGGYEISPSLVPFVELEGGHRFYRLEEDSAGFSRSADIWGARGGVELDLSDKLTGEISAGWISENFKDDRLAPVEGPTISALLSWSPERLTKVDAVATTILEGSTGANESGSMLYLGELAVERQVRANLTANAKIGGGYRDYTGEEGHDILFNAQVGATWWLNRYAGVSGRWRYESQSSTIEGRDYTANSFFLGLKVQR